MMFIYSEARKQNSFQIYADDMEQNMSFILYYMEMFFSIQDII